MRELHEPILMRGHIEVEVAESAERIVPVEAGERMT